MSGILVVLGAINLAYAWHGRAVMPLWRTALNAGVGAFCLIVAALR